jgi:hypothetical protein
MEPLAPLRCGGNSELVPNSRTSFLSRSEKRVINHKAQCKFFNGNVSACLHASSHCSGLPSTYLRSLFSRSEFLACRTAQLSASQAALEVEYASLIKLT